MKSGTRLKKMLISFRRSISFFFKFLLTLQLNQLKNIYEKINPIQLISYTNKFMFNSKTRLPIRL